MVREGRTPMNVGLAVPSADLQRLLSAQRMPEGWITAVVDSNGRIVARDPDPIVGWGRWPGTA